jgi:hypothetical protein
VPATFHDQTFHRDPTTLQQPTGSSMMKTAGHEKCWMIHPDMHCTFLQRCSADSRLIILNALKKSILSDMLKVHFVHFEHWLQSAQSALWNQHTTNSVNTERLQISIDATNVAEETGISIKGNAQPHTVQFSATTLY